MRSDSIHPAKGDALKFLPPWTEFAQRNAWIWAESFMMSETFFAERFLAANRPSGF